jgi:hypothetical protein
MDILGGEHQNFITDGDRFFRKVQALEQSLVQGASIFEKKLTKPLTLQKISDIIATNRSVIQTSLFTETIYERSN